MEILAHRGYWGQTVPSNSERALYDAIDNGFGFESDLRDRDGLLVVSHNMPNSRSPLAEPVFQKLSIHQKNCCFAINIKADGLIDVLKNYLEKYNVFNYFTFDMSFPQMLEYREKGIRFFTRQSEYERTPLLYEDSSGVWIDGFQNTDWITKNLLSEHLNEGKAVCIVSPELHQKDPIPFWTRLREFKLNDFNLLLCTDYPNKAKEFFTKAEGKDGYD